MCFCCLLTESQTLTEIIQSHQLFIDHSINECSRSCHDDWLATCEHILSSVRNLYFCKTKTLREVRVSRFQYHVENQLKWAFSLNYRNQNHDRWFGSILFTPFSPTWAQFFAVKEVSSDSSFCSHLTCEIVLLHFRGATCKNWPPVEFILKTIRGQHIGSVTANCCQLVSPVSRAASGPKLELGAPLGVFKFASLIK